MKRAEAEALLYRARKAMDSAWDAYQHAHDLEQLALDQEALVTIWGFEVHSDVETITHDVNGLLQDYLRASQIENAAYLACLTAQDDEPPAV